jgi:hypothetical protein
MHRALWVYYTCTIHKKGRQIKAHNNYRRYWDVCGSSQFTQANAGTCGYLRLRHDRFVQRPSHFVIHLFVVTKTKLLTRLLNKLQAKWIGQAGRKMQQARIKKMRYKIIRGSSRWTQAWIGDNIKMTSKQKECEAKRRLWQDFVNTIMNFL